MSDLRQRLTDEGFGVGTWSEPAYARAITIDEALEVFAAWLRERADENPYVLWQPADATEALRVLADEIDPPSPTRHAGA